MCLQACKDIEMSKFQTPVNVVWSDVDKRSAEQSGVYEPPIIRRQRNEEVEEVEEVDEVDEAEMAAMLTTERIRELVEGDRIPDDVEMATLLRGVNVERAFYIAVTSQNVEIARRILQDQNWLVETTSYLFGDESSALTYAVENGLSDMVDIIIGTGTTDQRTSRLLARDSNGMNCLMRAAEDGRENVVEVILGNSDVPLAKAQLEQRTVTRDTALILASRQGHLNVVKLLLPERAADAMDGLVIQNDGLETSLTPAEDAWSELFRENDERENALTLAAGKGYADIVNHILGVVDDTFAKRLLYREGNKNENVLMVAVKTGHLNVIAVLLKNRDLIKTQVTHKNSDNRNALMLAFSRPNRRRIDVIRALFSVNAEFIEPQVTQTGPYGRNALMMAIRDGDVDVVNELLSVSTRLVELQLRHRDGLGSTPLDAAEWKKDDVYNIVASHYYHASLLVPMFISYIDPTETESQKLYAYKLRNKDRFKLLFDAVASAIVAGRVTARELAVSYLGDLVQQTVEAARDVDAMFATFMNMIHASIKEQSDHVKPSKVVEQAMELFTKKYYGREYMNVYGKDMLALSMSLMEINEPDKEEQTKADFVTEKLSDPLIVAKIDRFLARHEPDDSQPVLAIEQNISALQSK